MHHPGLDTWTAVRRLKSPDATALVHGDGLTVTYRELADDTDRVAAVLAARGVGPGDRVAYLGENSPAFLTALFATVQRGAVFVPVNTRLAPPEIAHVLQDSGSRLLVLDPELEHRLPDGGPPRLRTGAGTPDEPGLAALAAALTPDDVAAVVPPAGRGPDDPAAIVYTSGTTGRAKGAVLTHGNLTWSAINTVLELDLVSSDVALMISPLFHVAALGMGALPVLLKGGTIVLEKGFDPGRALALVERYGVTLLSGVPTTYQLLADHPAWASTDLSTVTRLTCGGSAVPTRVLDAYEARGLSFSQGYGMTETSPGATQLLPRWTRSKQGSVGLPFFFTQVRVVDAFGAPAEPGVVGEIQVRGPNVFPGYHGLERASADAFADDGWFRSGDLGRHDEDGFLYICDRLKDMIISGGENIYPAEVENHLHGMEGVTGAAVVGVPDERWGEVPWAVVTVAPGTHLDTEAVRAHLDGRVARYKIPVGVVVVDELPRTASGKIRKDRLRGAVAG